MAEILDYQDICGRRGKRSADVEIGACVSVVITALTAEQKVRRSWMTYAPRSPWCGTRPDAPVSTEDHPQAAGALLELVERAPCRSGWPPDGGPGRCRSARLGTGKPGCPLAAGARVALRLLLGRYPCTHCDIGHRQNDSPACTWTGGAVIGWVISRRGRCRRSSRNRVPGDPAPWTDRAGLSGHRPRRAAPSPVVRRTTRSLRRSAGGALPGRRPCSGGRTCPPAHRRPGPS
jgi:hypothetical protein